MLQLSEDLLIGSGKKRGCYEDPENPNLCVKVLHSDSPPNTQLRETRYFKHLHRAGVSWKHVVPLIKMVPTTLGQGAVFELIRDKNGEVSKTMDFYLKLNEPSMDAFIVGELESMKQHLLEQNIMFRDLNPRNILLQENDDGNYHFKIIDGIGHNEFLPFCHIPYFGRKKVKRMWNRKMDSWYGRYEHLAHLITPFPD